MKSLAEYKAMSPETQLSMLKEAKGGSWYSDDWKPYCLLCTSFARMVKQPYGFSCSICGNMIGWDLCRVLESPLNEAKPSIHDLF